jgi:hypothetical protein
MNTEMSFGSGDHLASTTHKQHAVIDKFRVQVSLGSQIERIYDTAATGYKMEYTHGDECEQPGKRFSAIVEHTCDISSSPSAPKFLSYSPADCRYTFEWPSRQACTQCRADQTQQVPGNCEAMETKTSTSFRDSVDASWNSYTGLSKIYSQPLPGEQCNIFQPEEVKWDGQPIQTFEANQRTGGHIPSIEYVNAVQATVECNIIKDIVDSSPQVKFVSMVVAVLVGLIAICGLLICCSYCQLETKYQELQRTVTQ